MKRSGKKWETVFNQLTVTGTVALFLVGLCPVSFADTVAGADGSGVNTTSSQTDHVIVGDNNMQAENAGVAINGDTNNSMVNNNQNNLATGNNTNQNLLSPTIYSPSSNGGGNSVLMMPRNPLPLGNAGLGRSNFGVQFGLQNNPIWGGLSNSLSGRQNALGWFLQAGLTIPFGKIPDALKNSNAKIYDDMRVDSLQRQREIFGRTLPNRDAGEYQKKVQGRVSGMGAYNYTTLPSSQISLPGIGLSGSDHGEAMRIPQPKLLALDSADVYNKPLNAGNKIGEIQMGNEYPYLGHTKSGWVKLILPNGSEGWTSTHFEYVKNDFTEVDSLAVVPMTGKKQQMTVKAKPKSATAKTPVKEIKAALTYRQKVDKEQPITLKTSAIDTMAP